MKILSAQLCPFGAVENRQFDLADGLQVFVGPNEAGKSTLCQAILHGLFTSVDLPPKAREKAISTWYPRGGGDHAKVILKLRVNGDDWTLDKQWAHKQGDCRCSLRGPGLQLVDAAKVNAKLAELVGTGRAVWERILVASQSELNSTLKRLRDTKNTDGHDALDAVRQASRGLRAATDDVSPEAVGRIIERKIHEAWSNWDRAFNGPRGGKGAANRWEKEVGHVLRAYYKVETLKAAMAEAIAWEKGDERIRSELRSIEGKLADAKAWQTGHADVRDEIITSESGRADMTARQELMQQLVGESTRWTSLETECASLRDRLTEIGGAIAKLRVEQARLVEKCADELRNTRNARDCRPVPGAEELKEVRRISENISLERAQLDASVCRVRIEAVSSSQDVLFVEGLSASEKVRCETDTAIERDARGGFRVETRDIRITATLGAVDLDGLRRSVASAEANLKAKLLQWEVETVEEANTRAEEHRQVTHRMEQLEARLSELQEGKSFEEWREIVATATAESGELRDIAAVRRDLREQERQQATGQAKLDGNEREIARLKERYNNTAELAKKRGNVEAELEAARKESPAVSLPAGFATADEFLERWNAQLTQIEELEIEREEKRAELTRHERNAPRRSEDELAEDLRVAERELGREREAGESWLRIQAAFHSVVDAQDPLAATTDAVDAYLRSITAGRYRTEQVVDGVVCTLAGGPAGEMDVDMLSYGTGDALALATRLGLGKAMIPEGEGVLILDDPLTEMDRERQQCASQAIVEFARTRQVIVFTCRDEDAQLLHGDHVRVTPLESRL